MVISHSLAALVSFTSRICSRSSHSARCPLLPPLSPRHRGLPCGLLQWFLNRFSCFCLFFPRICSLHCVWPTFPSHFWWIRSPSRARVILPPALHLTYLPPRPLFPALPFSLPAPDFFPLCTGLFWDFCILTPSISHQLSPQQEAFPDSSMRSLSYPALLFFIFTPLCYPLYVVVHCLSFPTRTEVSKNFVYGAS